MKSSERIRFKICKVYWRCKIVQNRRCKI